MSSENTSLSLRTGASGMSIALSTTWWPRLWNLTAASFGPAKTMMGMCSLTLWHKVGADKCFRRVWHVRPELTGVLHLRLRLSGYDDECAGVSWRTHGGVRSCPRHRDPSLQTTPGGEGDFHQSYRSKIAHTHTTSLLLRPNWSRILTFPSLHLRLDTWSAAPSKAGRQCRAENLLPGAWSSMHRDHRGWVHD